MLVFSASFFCFAAHFCSIRGKYISCRKKKETTVTVAAAALVIQNTHLQSVPWLMNAPRIGPIPSPISAVDAQC